jgi:hypothetical protein
MWSTGLALLLCAVGAAGIVFTVWTVVPTARATGFHPVQGRVIASKFQRAGKGHLHRPVIEYTYVVEGKTYENDAYGVGPLNDEGSEAWAFAIFQRHPVGARCTVYYDPADPQISVLTTRPTLHAIAVTIGLILIAGVRLWAGMRFLSHPVLMTTRRLVRGRLNARRKHPRPHFNMPLGSPVARLIHRRKAVRMMSCESTCIADGTVACLSEEV